MVSEVEEAKVKEGPERKPPTPGGRLASGRQAWQFSGMTTSRTRFRIEFVLPRPGGYVALRLDEQAAPTNQWALLGEHMIRSVQQPGAREDLFAVQLDLDPDVEAPKAGDVLELTLLDES